VISRRDPSALIGVFTSDKIIGDEAAFYGAWEASHWSANQGYITLFGIRPVKPSTNYDYVKLGPELKRNQSFKIYLAD